jgi:hypothetical protein
MRPASANHFWIDLFRNGLFCAIMDAVMPSYRVYRLKDHLRQPFRSAPHVSGTASVKPRDYVPGLLPGENPMEFAGETLSASSPYAAYFERKDTNAPLQPGDLLEDESGVLRIFKFVGFEEAKWVLPEAAAEVSPVADPASV